MSQARSELLSRLQTIDACLKNPCVVDGLPSDTERNAAAAMFRSGLAILQFTTVESFIKERTGEILNSFSTTAVSFSNLSEALQVATTQRALEGLLFQAKMLETSSQIGWLISELPPIMNATRNLASLSKYSFGHARSNLSKEVIKDILQAFSIEGGWAAISSVAKTIGVGGIVDYSQTFSTLAERRHKSAHNATTNIPLNDLQSASTSIIGLCCSFDLLLSQALARYNRSEFPSVKNQSIKPSELAFKFITPHASKTGAYAERVLASNGSGTLKTIRIHPTQAAARQSALKKPKIHLIELNASGIPVDWSSWK